MTFLTIKNLTFYYYEAGLENCCEKPSFIFVHPKTFKSPHVIIGFFQAMYKIQNTLKFGNISVCISITCISLHCKGQTEDINTSHRHK